MRSRTLLFIFSIRDATCNFCLSLCTQNVNFAYYLLPSRLQTIVSYTLPAKCVIPFRKLQQCPIRLSKFNNTRGPPDRPVTHSTPNSQTVQNIKIIKKTKSVRRFTPNIFSPQFFSITWTVLELSQKNRFIYDKIKPRVFEALCESHTI